jgi:diaminopimelate decarboxylase
MRPKLYGAHHHISNISNPEATKRFYTVVGYICETDTFARDRELPEIRESDILCFHNAGAYCYSMASNYNSRGRPAEILIKDGKASVVRRAETLEDLTRLSV